MKKEKSHKETLDEMKALLQRTQADFVNYKRRNEEARSDFIKNAHADIIVEILPVLDNFLLAAKHVPEDLKEDNWVCGVQAIEKQLEQILETNGLEKIKTVGEEFDHNLHDAIGQDTVKDKKNNEIISEELAGYILNGKLLRPAKVIVNNLKSKKASGEASKGE